MNTVFEEWSIKKRNKLCSLVILLDPDKIVTAEIDILFENIEKTNADYIFIGGSKVSSSQTQNLVAVCKKRSKIPLILFPGDLNQLSLDVNAVLFLSLISGDNPEYLIGQQIKAAPLLLKAAIETISTGYIHIDGQNKSSISKVSKTKPIDPDHEELILNTAQAALLIGMKCIYLEAGSGAKRTVPLPIVQKISQEINLPLIVGGGIKTQWQAIEIAKAGANLIVIGNQFELNPQEFVALGLALQKIC